MKEANLIPELRFPDFSNNWKEKALGEIATFSKGKNISKADIDPNGKLECIRYGELYTEYSEVINDIKSRTNLNSDELVLSEKNDVIIPASGETQIDIATASCVLKEGIALGGDLNIIKSPLNGVFLSYYLNSRKKKDIARLSQGISVVHLYSNQLKALKICIPKPKEQKKTASFLTSTDKRIALLKQKKEKLEQYKKGMMQKIFSQKIRFNITNKDGELVEPPNWEEFKIGEIFKQRTKRSHDNSLLLSVTINNGVILQSETNKRDSSNSDKSNYKKVVKYDIVYNSMRMWQGSSGISNYNGIVSPAYTVLEGNALNSSLFFSYYFKMNNLIQIFQRNSQGLTPDTWNLKYPQLSQIKIKRPSLEEQQKIALFLSSIDKSIVKLESQIEASQEWKNGLLQKMFV